MPRTLANTLRGRSGAFDANAVDALRQRNRIMTILDDRVRNVRSAARYVFRNHPEIARVAMSSYSRRRRLAFMRGRTDDPGVEPEPSGGDPTE